MSELTGSAAESPGGLFVERNDRQPAVVLAVRGDVDRATVPTMRAAVGEAVAGSPPVFVLDLTDVEFLASAGLSELVVLSRDIPDGTALRIVAEGRATLRPIQLTGLDSLLPLYPTIEAALDSQ